MTLQNLANPKLDSGNYDRAKYRKQEKIMLEYQTQIEKLSQKNRKLRDKNLKLKEHVFLLNLASTKQGEDTQLTGINSASLLKPSKQTDNLQNTFINEDFGSLLQPENSSLQIKQIVKNLNRRVKTLENEKERRGDLHGSTDSKENAFGFADSQEVKYP